MAYIANQIDYDLAKKANPNADVRLYTPGMTIGANDVVLGGSAVIPDSALNGAQRIWGNDRYETQKAFQNYDTNVRPLNELKSALQSQRQAQTNLANQQAADRAAQIRQAIERQKQQGEATKADYTNQMNTAINTLNTERARIPGQITNLNNQASSTGMVNAQHIRNALAQMGLLQSGESASQQLQNETTVANQINANNLQGQQLDVDYGNKIAAAQQDLAAKVKQINDAIALAQSQGDEQSLMALQDAQAKIAAAAAQNAVDYQNWAYKIGRDAIGDRQWQQTYDANQIQQAIDNAYRQHQTDLAQRQWEQNFGLQQGQLLGVYNGQPTLSARELASSIANAQARASVPKAPSATEINNQNKQVQNQVVSNIYNQIYTQYSSNAEALNALYSQKGQILEALATAGFSPTDALAFWQSMRDDLAGKVE